MANLEIDDVTMRFGDVVVARGQEVTAEQLALALNGGFLLRRGYVVWRSPRELQAAPARVQARLFRPELYSWAGLARRHWE